MNADKINPEASIAQGFIGVYRRPSAAKEIPFL